MKDSSENKMLSDQSHRSEKKWGKPKHVHCKSENTGPQYKYQNLSMQSTTYVKSKDEGGFLLSFFVCLIKENVLFLC